MFYNAELFQEMKGFARKLMKRDAKRSKAKRLSKKAATRVEPAGDDFSGLQNMEQRVLLSANVFGHSVASHSFENINLVAGDSGVTPCSMVSMTARLRSTWAAMSSPSLARSTPAPISSSCRITA